MARAHRYPAISGEIELAAMQHPVLVSIRRRRTYHPVLSHGVSIALSDTLIKVDLVADLRGGQPRIGCLRKGSDPLSKLISALARAYRVVVDLFDVLERKGTRRPG